MSTRNGAGQIVEGGVPITRLTLNDVVEYWGAIVGVSSDGEVLAWNGSTFNMFENKRGKYYYMYSVEVPDIDDEDFSDVISDVTDKAREVL